VAGGTTVIVSSRQATPAVAAATPVEVAPSARSSKKPPPAQTPASPPAVVAPAPSVETPTPVATVIVPATAITPPSPAPVVPVVVPTAAAPATETAPGPSSLDVEIALVRDAREALRVGDATRALVLLDEHARRFSGGALSEDCDALRIQALCALGRVGEARDLTTRFLTSHSASPHAPAVRASCGGGEN
jgi:hypothetical protein